MGEEAAKILLEMPSEPVHRYLPFALVERESVAQCWKTEKPDER
jgi:DNA-binding LacI/PurR family transcriptional regulator